MLTFCCAHVGRRAAHASRSTSRCRPTARLRLVLNQDIAVLATMQRGLHQPGFTHLTLSSEECRIINMHRNLERALGIGPDDPAALTVSRRAR